MRKIIPRSELTEQTRTLKLKKGILEIEMEDLCFGFKFAHSFSFDDAHYSIKK
jgi:hypothetical protein